MSSSYSVNERIEIIDQNLRKMFVAQHIMARVINALVVGTGNCDQIIEIINNTTMSARDGSFTDEDVEYAKQFMLESISHVHLEL
ncbi:hypothetical protein [Edwardsiella anguillarum]|uniref:Uncharacterized protein n=1 Tax=Edwardsiella anguillarum ET080813 TaxID=667120 RepID=A0A076LK88_9GAMM|nr:hypothetical protein [Edwardsiella anguillarum]AIJ07018.1 Hypothetical protein ETEE_0543 [Edwardsiella anguillarum ET080813]KAB0586259.1 hypothetical protein F7P84_19035 [Edwardsiella anguillarum]